MRSPQRLLPPLILGAAAAAAFALGYGCWPDVLVDTGRELYVPWRIVQGQVLYRDLAYFNGPLSPYVNAGAMVVMGVAMRSLVIVNCLVIAAVVAMLYRLVRRFAGRLAATMAGLTFIALFAFSQYTAFGGYNWVFPYSHEMTHGIALALASLCALIAAADCPPASPLRDKAGVRVITAQTHDGPPLPRNNASLYLLAAGLALGATFLTKPEIFAAAAMTNLVVLVFFPAKSWRRFAFWLAGVIAPVALAGLLLGMTPAFGAWRYVASQLAADDVFYRKVMGIDHPGHNLLLILAWSTGYFVIFAFFALLGLGRRAASKLLPAIAFGFVLLCLLLAQAEAEGLIDWAHFACPLPVAALALVVWFGRGAMHRRTPAALARLGLAVFSLTLLGKIVLAANIFHYGFGLAMPAMALVAVFLIDTLPAALDRRGVSGRPLRAAAIALWLGVVAVHVMMSGARFRQDTVAIGAGGDRFFAPADRGEPVKDMLEELARDAQPGDTLAVFPEGVSINYLARIPNPTPYINFMPVELSMFGQDNVLAAFQSHSPGYVLLVDKDTSEYGYRHFGMQYGRSILAWIVDHYAPIRAIGSQPLVGKGFGIMLFHREKALAASTP